MTNICVLEGK